jgi:hypothetical protein
MKHVESKYRQFPTAILLPDLATEYQLTRQQALIEWRDSLGLVYQQDYICFEHTEGRGFRARTHMAWAFKNKGHALQFKLSFAGWAPNLVAEW